MWGGRPATGCCHSRSPATSATPPAPAGQGDPKPSCTGGCVNPEKNAQEQQNLAQKQHHLAYGAAALVMGCVSLRICQTRRRGGCNFCLKHLAELIPPRGCGSRGKPGAQKQPDDFKASAFTPTGASRWPRSTQRGRGRAGTPSAGPRTKPPPLLGQHVQPQGEIPAAQETA